jgi:drug/metabolite transporter (DMT)-like permease
MVALQGRPPPARGDRVKHAFTSRSVRAGGVSLRGHVTIQPPAGIRGFFHQLGPVLMTAVTFSTADICGKVALTSGTDVTTMLSFRSVIGVGLVFAWLRLSKPAALPPAATWISLGLGVLLTANMYLLFKAIDLVPVSIAVLTYFIYPLLTGIIGAMTGIDRLTVTGTATALAAFFGLALIIGANPADLAAAGLAAAVGGALCRAAMLLITRAALKGADARVVTWHTMCSSTLGFFALSLVAWSWRWPHGVAGWTAFIGIAFAVPIGVFALYVSTERIGPFRTALFMNLEPLMTSTLGALLLGERLTPVQMLGGATMIVALCAFQMRR